MQDTEMVDGFALGSELLYSAAPSYTNASKQDDGDKDGEKGKHCFDDRA